MRCPVCGADHPANQEGCPASGAKPARPSRRRTLASTPDVWSDGRSLARTAFLCSVWGLIPLLGLILGPMAFILGLVAWRQVQNDGGAKRSSARAAVFLGGLVLFTNWVGFALILLSCGADH